MTSTETLDDVITELQVLWPALPGALPRDAGTQASERVSTSENVHTLPLNPDVAAVITDLTARIPEWVAWACQCAGETPTTHAGIPLLLGRVPALYDRLSGQGRTRDAHRLADVAQHWLSACRRALGLNRPDRPIGEMCPKHDHPLTPLVQPGDHGHLRYDRLNPDGQPVNPTVSWTRIELVLCRHCDAAWTPERYMHLGRLIRQANRDRQAAEPGDHMERAAVTTTRESA